MQKDKHHLEYVKHFLNYVQMIHGFHYPTQDYPKKKTHHHPKIKLHSYKKTQKNDFSAGS